MTRWMMPAALGATLLVTAEAGASCFPVACPGCDVSFDAQANLVVMDRTAGEVRLIPNIRLVGSSDEFAILMPTPSMPSFHEASANIWTDAFALTAPLRASRSDDDGGFGCSTGSDEPVFAANEGVIIHQEETIGDFDVVVISSDSPDALVSWLVNAGFPLTEDDADAAQPYVDRGWLFTAMTLADGVEIPSDPWVRSVAPLEIRFAADEFEVPLPLLAINRTSFVTMSFLVVDDHRVTLPGFETSYVNRVSADELRAIEIRHRAMAPYLSTGRFITRLDRTFFSSDPMAESVVVRRAGTDAELIVLLGSTGTGAWSLMAAAGALIAWQVRRRRGRRT